MATIMEMPKIGVNMTEGQIVSWFVKAGDQIKEGDPLFEAETDKSTQEIYATKSGKIGRLLAQAGDVVACYAPLIVLVEEGEGEADIDRLLGAAPKQQASAPIAAAAPVTPPKTQGAQAQRRIKISPLAKKTAAELHVDYKLLAEEVGERRIVRKDILRFSEKQNAASLPVKAAESCTAVSDAGVGFTIPLAGVRKVISERMSESNQTKPSVGLVAEVDMTEALLWRERVKARGGRASYNDIVLKVVAKALREFPVMNSLMGEQEIRCMSQINIGVAVDTEKGLMVPVVRDVDRKGVLEINREISEKAERAKNGALSPDDLSDGTFTVTNLGAFDIIQFTPIINPPQCNILSLGAVVKRAVVLADDTIAARPIMQMTLVFDHRMVDGAPAAKCLQRIKFLMENPMELLN